MHNDPLTCGLKEKTAWIETTVEEWRCGSYSAQLTRKLTGPRRDDRTSKAGNYVRGGGNKGSCAS